MRLEQVELKKLFLCQGEGVVSRQFFSAAKKVERRRGAEQMRCEFGSPDFFETVPYGARKRWRDIGNDCATLVIVDGGQGIRVPAEVQNDDWDFRFTIIVGIKRSRLRSYGKERDGNNKERSRK